MKHYLIFLFLIIFFISKVNADVVIIPKDNTPVFFKECKKELPVPNLGVGVFEILKNDGSIDKGLYIQITVPLVRKKTCQ